MATLVLRVNSHWQSLPQKMPATVTVTVIDLAYFGDAIQIENILIMSHCPKKASQADSLSHCRVFLQQCFANVKNTSKTKI
jgi:hypothetical protein